ncbi:cuticle protein-like [Aphidius gifuensis]|uniref:cuticle protein-like n=1 Tax=Aphidius gifuensis TaxID=684658 RepID=UPI001CDB9858|nr:cuticle protein-like [Aphidius gifuensis]
MNSIIVFAVFLAIAQAEVISASTSSTITDTERDRDQPDTLIQTEPYDANPQYSYSYSVADGLTGDNKAQEETRNGDQVRGSYSLVEPTGSRRIVSYASDPLNGFNAVIQRDPTVTLSARTIATAPVYRSSQTGQIIDQQSGPTAVFATANANVHRQSTLVSSSSPYLSSGLGVNVRASSLYNNQPVIGNLAYGPLGLVRVR